MEQERFDELSAMLLGMLAPEDRKYFAAVLRSGKLKASQVQRMIDELQTQLDELRLSTKYLVFDLEATRRERDDLQDQLDRWAA